MNIWTFGMILVGIFLSYVGIVFSISAIFKLSYDQKLKLINIGGIIMCIIGFCFGFCMGDKLVW